MSRWQIIFSWNAYCNMRCSSYTCQRTYTVWDKVSDSRGQIIVHLRNTYNQDTGDKICHLFFYLHTKLQREPECPDCLSPTCDFSEKYFKFYNLSQALSLVLNSMVGVYAHLYTSKKNWHIRQALYALPIHFVTGDLLTSPMQ